MGLLYDSYDIKEQRGSEILIPDYFPTIFISERDEAFCYTGMLFNEEERHDVSLQKHPYYTHKKHSTDKRFVDKIKGFFRIINGCICLDNYIDVLLYSDINYKCIDGAHIRLPVSTQIYYGVMVNRNEDAALTKAVFGLTCDELRVLLNCYSKVFGTNNLYMQYPRLTRSIRSYDFCDLTEQWIPAQFPYIAFSESQYDFSHVSLWGFYRHMQLLMQNKISSTAGQALLKAGVSETLLEDVLNISKRYGYLMSVTKETVMQR